MKNRGILSRKNRDKPVSKGNSIYPFWESEFEGMRQEIRPVPYAPLQNKAKLELFLLPKETISLAQGNYFSCPREFFLLGKGFFFDAHLGKIWTCSPLLLNLFSVCWELVLRVLRTCSPLALIFDAHLFSYTRLINLLARLSGIFFTLKR